MEIADGQNKGQPPLCPYGGEGKKKRIRSGMDKVSEAHSLNRSDSFLPSSFLSFPETENTCFPLPSLSLDHLPSFSRDNERERERERKMS